MPKATREDLKRIGVHIVVDDPIESLIALLERIAIVETAFEEKRGSVPEVVKRGIEKRVRSAHLPIPDGERHFKIWENVRAEESRLGRELTDEELSALGASRIY